jgi:hypothetical protein
MKDFFGIYLDPINNKWLDTRGHNDLLARWKESGKLGIAMDITDIKRMEEIRRRRNKH